MSSQFQNFKNFIRHARHAPDPPAAAPQPHALSDPTPQVGGNLHNQHYKHDYSVNAADNRNIAAQATGAAAETAGQYQNMEDISAPGGNIGGGIGQGAKAYDQDTLAKIIAEEKANREKLPRYPGLDRWILVQKMGDGAFSNVYRARDMQGVYEEVAIKVVRKFELNASQV
jgi:hypothetical protein